MTGRKRRKSVESRNASFSEGGPIAEDKGFHQTDYNIIGNQKERGRTVEGCNPISNLISGILNARDNRSSAPRTKNRSDRKSEKVEIQKRNKHDIGLSSPPRCVAVRNLSAPLDFESASIDRCPGDF